MPGRYIPGTFFMSENTATVNINRKGHRLYHVESDTMQGVELEIDTGDQHRTRWSFQFIDGEVFIKKVNIAAGKDGQIHITPHLSNIITLK